MKHRTFFFAGLVVSLATTMGAARMSAQPGTQPFAFYSEEPWGGSYLGVDTDDITSERVGPLHLKEERGVEVTMVDQDAPAAKAGLKEHDVILSINDQQVQGVEQLRRLIREIPAGRTISIGISRDGQPMTLKAQLADRNKIAGMDRHMDFVVPPVPPVPPVNVPAIHIPPINIPEMDFANVVVIHSPARSGLMIENLTPQLGEFFGVKSGKGVLVRSVERGSRAESAGFRAGDVITKINGSPIDDCSDFTRLLRKGADNKSSVTVVRDKREQNLTLSLPEPKRSGAVFKEESDIDEACADLLGTEPAIAELQSRVLVNKSAIDAEMKKLRPQLEKMQREYRVQMDAHRGEIKKQMELMQKDMLKQKDEMKKQMKDWMGKASEI